MLGAPSGRTAQERGHGASLKELNVETVRAHTTYGKTPECQADGIRERAGCALQRWRLRIRTQVGGRILRAAGTRFLAIGELAGPRVQVKMRNDHWGAGLGVQLDTATRRRWLRVPKMRWRESAKMYLEQLRHLDDANEGGGAY